MVYNIAKVVPTVQAATLVTHNANKLKKKNVSAKDILKLGVTNVVGADLITRTASIAGGL